MFIYWNSRKAYLKFIVKKTPRVATTEFFCKRMGTDYLITYIGLSLYNTYYLSIIFCMDWFNSPNVWLLHSILLSTSTNDSFFCCCPW